MKQNELNQKFFLTQMKPISDLLKGKEILVERALPPLEKKTIEHAKEAKLFKEEKYGKNDTVKANAQKELSKMGV